MLKKKLLKAAAAALPLALLLAACGGGSAAYADGTYTGQSSVFVNDDGTDDGNGYGVVSITIKNNAITDCSFQTFEPDGTLKDENYGKKGGDVHMRDYYNKAQKAVAACDEYASQLLQSGRIEDVDSISGATVNYNSFKEAVDIALSGAKEGASSASTSTSK